MRIHVNCLICMKFKIKFDNKYHAYTQMNNKKLNKEDAKYRIISLLYSNLNNF